MTGSGQSAFTTYEGGAPLFPGEAHTLRHTDAGTSCAKTEEAFASLKRLGSRAQGESFEGETHRKKTETYHARAGLVRVSIGRFADLLELVTPAALRRDQGAMIRNSVAGATGRI